MSSLRDVLSPQPCLGIIWGSAGRRGPELCQGERRVLNTIVGQGLTPCPGPVVSPSTDSLGVSAVNENVCFREDNKGLKNGAFPNEKKVS